MNGAAHQTVNTTMAAVQLEADAIGGELRLIRDALRDYLDDKIHLHNRKVKGPTTKGGREFMEDILGRLNQVSTGVDKHLSSHNTPPPARGPDTPISYNSPASHPVLPPNAPSDAPLRDQEQASLPQPSQPSQPLAPSLSQPPPPQTNGSASLAPVSHVSHPSGASEVLEPSVVSVGVSSKPNTPPTHISEPPSPALANQHPHQPQQQQHQPKFTPQSPLSPQSQTEGKDQSHAETQSQAKAEAGKSQTPQDQGITLSNGAVYHEPIIQPHEASPLFDCMYQDVNDLNEELFEQYSNHPVVKDRGYFKLQVRELPPLQVRKVERPSKDHATSFRYVADKQGLVKVDTGKKKRFTPPHLPFPVSEKTHWTLQEQKELWNSSAATPPKGTRGYIIGNPLFDDIELHPGNRLKSRGRTILEGINTQYVYFNLEGLTITTMHREDAHVRSENLLRSGQHKFWCFVKPAFSDKLEEKMAAAYPEMRRCSQAVRHLSRHIPPAKLDEWGIEYTLDYCIPGQAVVTEPGTYHQVLNLGPNYALAVNVEYMSSPEDPPNYRFCDKNCPDPFAMKASDFGTYGDPNCLAGQEEQARLSGETPDQEEQPRMAARSSMFQSAPEQPSPPSQSPLAAPQLTQSVTPPPEHSSSATCEPSQSGLVRPEALIHRQETSSQPMAEPNVHTFQSFQPPRESSLGSVLRLPSEAGKVTSYPTVERSDPSPQPPAAPPPLAVEPTIGASEPRQSQPPSEPAPGWNNAVFCPEYQETAPRSQLLRHPNTFLESSDQPFQTTHQAGPFSPHHNVVPLPPPQRQTSLVPLRKTARLVHNKRHTPTDSLSPRSAKRQRIMEYLRSEDPFGEEPAPEMPQSYFTHASQSLATLLRSCQDNVYNNIQPQQVSGRPAFDRLARLIKDWRRYVREQNPAPSGLDLVTSLDRLLQDEPELHMFLSRFCKMKLAEWLDAKAIEQERARPAPHPAQQDATDLLLRELGWGEAERHKLNDYIREGKCWKTICGAFDGFLCLVPPDPVFQQLALFQDKVVMFHHQFNDPFLRAMCAVGKTLQSCIWESRELPEFVFESEDTIALSTEELAPMLKQYKYITANVFSPHAPFPWPKPVGWKSSWLWPVDPTMVYSEKWCNVCKKKKSCRCYARFVPDVPRVSIDGSKGSGVRVMGMFRANDVIGEMLGELVPPGAIPNREWTMEFRRPDLDDVVVAELYSKEQGNWARNVRHSANPSCEISIRKMEGKWRMLIIASRQLFDGEEVTVKYGRGYYRNQAYGIVEGF
ncbi:hypothetical protein QBC41DRAFT_106185 [Cercophora samala]|uniref:Uncharacterized protein n=1 Tax=Cercophora samala TaxID=330535 RepID=A0AA39ZEJ9_9PEZI|nr:hypothetical protein QBC41DRAFT_106185 [Cercophora samala]